MGINRSMFHLNSLEIKLKDIILIILFCCLPFTMFIGTGLSNLTIILIDLFLIYELSNNKDFKIFKNNFFYILIFLWFFLILNSIFIAKNTDSLIRSFGLLRFILLAFSIKYFFHNKESFFKKTVLNFWFFIFIITTIDLMFEFSTGADLLGFKSNYNGRLAGFTGDELRIGGYYFGFILISLSNSFFNEKKIRLLTFSLIFLITALIIGERSNFIKIFFILIFFLILINRTESLKKFFLYFVIFLLIITVTSLNNLMLKTRFFDDFFIPVKNYGISHYVKNSRHGRHYDMAIRIFKQNPILGIGIKNFRYESIKAKYNIYDKKDGHTTHPHQLHFELLSETGLVGYLLFLFFFIYSILFGFNSYLKKNNTLALCGTLFLVATIIPIIPMGSFFSSYGAAIFWINFGLLITEQD
jgi:O-antigen ligase